VGQYRPGLLDIQVRIFQPGGSGTIFGVLSGAGSTNPGFSVPSGAPTLSVNAYYS